MGWLITLGILVLLALIPVGGVMRYENGTFQVKLKVAFIPFRIPLEKKQKEEKPEEPEKPQAAPAPAAPPKKRKLRDFQPLLSLALDFLGDLRRKLILDRLELHLVLAGEDPCDLGVLYGSAWAAAGNIQALIERCFIIRSRDVDIRCDFQAEKTVLSGRLELHMCLGRILALGAGYGLRAMKEFMKIRKGGAVK